MQYRNFLEILVFFLILMTGCANNTIQYTSKLSSDDASVRGEAVQALGLMGSEAETAVDKLIHMVIRDPDLEVRRLAVEALGYIQPLLTMELMDAFIIALNDHDIDLRRAAVIAINRFTNFPPNIITTLQRHLTDPDVLVRELVMCTFERLGKLGVRTLLRGLKDENDEMRLAAAVTLGRLGDIAVDAIDDLKKVQGTDTSEDVKKAAAEALRVISE